MQTHDFIRALPKAEMHLHLEGAVPWDMVRARATTLPSPPPWWAADYRFGSFSHFSDVIRQCYGPTLTSVDDYRAAARTVFAGLVAQNVRYVEISFSLGHALARNLPPAELVASLKQAAPAELVVRVFCGISRSRAHLLRHDATATILDLPHLDGLDLHGGETVQGASPFRDLFARARERGLAIKAHAGELAGPSLMQDTMDTLQVTRIEHGVRAIEDEQLMARLVDQAITLDMCPTSNVKLRVVENAAAHPIRRFHERGVRVTVSTDNPTILGCSLTDELYSLVHELGFAPSDLADLQRNAFRVALVTPAERAGILAEIDTVSARG